MSDGIKLLHVSKYITLLQHGVRKLRLVVSLCVNVHFDQRFPFMMSFLARDYSLNINLVFSWSQIAKQLYKAL